MCSDVSLFVEAEASPNFGESHHHPWSFTSTTSRCHTKNGKHGKIGEETRAVSQEHAPTLVNWCTASSSLVREMLVDVAALLAPLPSFEAMTEGIHVDVAVLLTLFFLLCSVAYYQVRQSSQPNGGMSSAANVLL